jgi:hypothetical protein
MSSYDSAINNTLGKALENKYIFAVIHLVLFLYASSIAPVLPPRALVILDNFFVKLFALFLILFSARVSPSISILVALCFLVTMNYINHNKFIEFLENTPTDLSPIDLDQDDGTPQKVDTTMMADTVTIKPLVLTNTDGQTVLVTPTVDITPTQVVDKNGNVESVYPIVNFTTMPPTTTTTVSPVTAPTSESTQPSPTSESTQPIFPITQQAETTVPLQSGCLPNRKVNMENVEALDSEDDFGTVSFK